MVKITDAIIIKHKLDRTKTPPKKGLKENHPSQRSSQRRSLIIILIIYKLARNSWQKTLIIHRNLAKKLQQRLIMPSQVRSLLFLLLNRGRRDRRTSPITLPAASPPTKPVSWSRRTVLTTRKISLIFFRKVKKKREMSQKSTRTPSKKWPRSLWINSNWP